MGKLLRAMALAGVGAGLLPTVQAAIIGNGPFGNSPQIIGTVKPGEADEVAQDFAGGFKKPLTLILSANSDPVEVARIGLWLKDRRPALQLKGDCVGSCARSILLSGGTVTVKPGSVIAFGGMAEVGARMKEQIDAGDLFSADERSQASRDRFLKVFKPWIDRGVAVREQYALQAALPDTVRSFIEAVTGRWRVERVSFAAEDFNFSLKSAGHACLWWVPDAEGLKQLGLDVPGYQPASRSEAAQRLKVPEYFVHVGPALETLPEQPLCAEPVGAPNFSVTSLP